MREIFFNGSKYFAFFTKFFEFFLLEFPVSSQRRKFLFVAATHGYKQEILVRSRDSRLPTGKFWFVAMTRGYQQENSGS